MVKLNKKVTKTLKKKQYNLFKCELMPACDQIKNNVCSDAIAFDEKKKQDNRPNETNGQSAPEKLIVGKKSNSFYQKCARKRQEKGMIILTEKLENKIYKLKKALRKKGMDPNEIKDIINRKRRDEENKFRKDSKQLCYKCRQTGHSLANCPNISGTDTSADICYCCGSTEHRLSDCSKYKSSGKNDRKLPYAKCFLCNQVGHLTRSCKSNSNGIFPNGGKCLLCGSKNHLIKDCDKNEEKPEPEMILKTYDDLEYGLDVDEFEIGQTKSILNSKKVVKF